MVERLREALVADELHLAAYRALASTATLHEAIATADPDAAELLTRLAVEDPDEDADDVMIRLMEQAGKRVLDDLQREARTAPSPEGYAPVVGWLKVTLEELRQPHSRRAAEERLVPWLVARSEAAHE
jgi:hypothetical protein